jgi:ubiquinone/menaquinone biosynthesis C-methylase UbiE
VTERFHFYVTTGATAGEVSQNIEAETKISVWRPGWFRVVPEGAPLYPYLMWWLLHQMRLFSNRDYAVVFVREDGRTIHRSGVFPMYFRFPFMAREDLQIGHTWTQPTCRGRGLATIALKWILAHFSKPGRLFWYVAPEWNYPSLSVAKEAAFTLVGTGERCSSSGLRILGNYAMDRFISPRSSKNESLAVAINERYTQIRNWLSLNSKIGNGKAMHEDYESVTESGSQNVTIEALKMAHTRYGLAAELAVGRDVLEVACGAGQGLGLIAERARFVLGSDLTDSLLLKAREEYGDAVRLIRCDALDLPFASGRFDLVILLEAIYYLTDPTVFIKECRRVLRPGGRILLSSANNQWNGFIPSKYSVHYFSIAELRNLLGREGFRAQIFACFASAHGHPLDRIIIQLRKLADKLGLIPHTLKRRARLKRMFLGKLVPFPNRLERREELREKLVAIKSETDRCTDHRIIYAVGSLDREP